MPENLSKRVSVSAMGGDERRSVEHLLGHRLEDDEQVYILAFKPGVVPDAETRRRAVASMQQTFAATERHAEQHGITDAQIDEAIDEAMEHVRYGQS